MTPPKPGSLFYAKSTIPKLRRGTYCQKIYPSCFNSPINTSILMLTTLTSSKDVQMTFPMTKTTFFMFELQCHTTGPRSLFQLHDFGTLLDSKLMVVEIFLSIQRNISFLNLHFRNARFRLIELDSKDLPSYIPEASGDSYLVQWYNEARDMCNLLELRRLYMSWSLSWQLCLSTKLPQYYYTMGSRSVRSIVAPYLLEAEWYRDTIRLVCVSWIVILLTHSIIVYRNAVLPILILASVHPSWGERSSGRTVPVVKSSLGYVGLPA
jgi:hypothetical protein